MDKKGILTRNISFDLLRVLSALSVVVLHVSAQYIMISEVDSLFFRLSNFLNSISRFGVPIFVMLSGVLFLSEDKELSIKKIWTKYILRTFMVYAVWSFAYYVFQSLYMWKFDFWNHGIARTILGCVYASDHFWFLFMIMGLYALVPVLRTWVHNATKKELDYFIGLFFVFQILRTTAALLIDKTLVQEILNMVKIIELSYYLGYFILGYRILKYGLPKVCKTILYALVPVCVVANYFISDWMSVKTGSYSAGIYDSFGVFTFFIVVAIFVFFTDTFANASWNAKVSNMLGNLSKNTLGIYVMHVGALTYLVHEGILNKIPHPVAGTVIISLFLFIVCSVVASLLRRIPFVGRYIC